MTYTRSARETPFRGSLLNENTGSALSKNQQSARKKGQAATLTDILVQSRRNTKAAKRFFRKLLKSLHYAPRVVVTDTLKSYGAAKRESLPHVKHQQSKYLNNRAEVSRPSTRRRERQMQRFKSACHTQRFLSTHAHIHNHFQLHRLTATHHRAISGTALLRLA